VPYFYARLAFLFGDVTGQSLFSLLLQAPALTTFWQRGLSLLACQQQPKLHRTAAAEAAAAMANPHPPQPQQQTQRQPQAQQQHQQTQAQEQQGQQPAGSAA
jgi:hypothetical protein